jgi:hypothetical protein
MKDSDKKSCRNKKSNYKYDYDYVDDKQIIMDLIATSQMNPNNL